MTRATGQLLSVKSRLKRNLVQRDQERKVQNGNVQMTNSTTLSGKPSLPATRYRLLKVFAAKGSRPNCSRANCASVPLGFQPEESAFSRN